MISTGNHVMFARFVSLAVSEEAKTWLPFFFVQCIINQLLDSVFVISRTTFSVRVISRSRRLTLITRTSTLIILDITKTLSNNCLVLWGLSWSYSVKRVEDYHGVVYLFLLCSVGFSVLYAIPCSVVAALMNLAGRFRDTRVQVKRKESQQNTVPEKPHLSLA